MAAPEMTEDQLQAAVTDLARMAGLLVYHTYDSRRSQAGFPDVAVCGPRGFLLRELKTARGQLRREQNDWAQWLLDAGVNYGIWRPADLRSGRITRELRAIR